MTEENKPEEIIAVPEKDQKTFKRGVQLFVVYITIYTLFTIAGTVRTVLEGASIQPDPDLDDIYAADHAAREDAAKCPC